MANNNSLVVFEPENIQTIAEIGPVAIKENNVSHDRCLEAGRSLLARIQREGMNDQLDQDIALYIEKAKKTVKKMNDKRTPVTKLFDAIRTSFTALEADVNPSSKGSIPAELQEHRNRYAAAKREEQLRKQREEAARQARIQAIQRYTIDLEQSLITQLNNHIVGMINSMTAVMDRLSIDNYDESYNNINNIAVELQEDWINNLKGTVMIPTGLSTSDCKSIESDVKNKIRQRCHDQYASEIGDYRADILDRMPSKRIELQRIAKANEEEAARLKAELEAKEREEAARKERELREAEAAQKAAQELAAKKQNMDNLFGQAQVTMSNYQPKTQVKKCINVLNPEGFMEVVGLWWSQYGCTLSVAELSKTFSKQITFCNKLANDKDNPMTIQSEHIEYVEDVKAK